jgi:hypothetical protein
VDQHELARRAHGLAGRFADRLDPADLAAVREYAEAGEWGEEIDLLVACPKARRQPVTIAEREELVTLLDAMGTPAGPAEVLRADGS